MSLHKADEFISDAEVSLALLKEGNERYLKEQHDQVDSFEAIRTCFTKGQHPFATILCCSDSRVAPEVFFDQCLGDVFVIRNAGNVVDDATEGSLEYAAKHLKTPLIVVIGHSSCGAVTAACKNAQEPPHIMKIIKRIEPSIVLSKNIEETSQAHAKAMADLIKSNETIAECNTKVVPAYYNVCTGKVEWLEYI